MMDNPSFQKQLARLQPEKVNTREDLAGFLRDFTADVVKQPSLESVHLEAGEQSGEINVTGWVCYPAMKAALEGLLARAALSPIGIQVQVLPTVPLESPYKSTALFGVTRARVEGRSAPDPKSEVVTIWEEGDRIRPIHWHAGHFLCRMDCGYLAWVPDAELHLRALPGGDCQFSAAEQAVWQRALEPYLDAPYVWGGTGREGIDCSGLVQRLYRARGIHLPRDSDQQMLVGELVATPDAHAPHLPGDLLFFTHADGRIGHVGVSLGGWRVVHAEEPRVTCFSLDPRDREYNRERAHHFVLAKRVVAQYLGRKGIG